MSKSGAKRHVHKYFRGPSDLWGCGFGDCTHVMPTNMTFMMPGRKSVCWICAEQFLLTPANLRQIKPLCNDCWLKAHAIDPTNTYQVIEELIRKKTEEAARELALTEGESAVIINEVDSDCMTPEVCKTGVVEIMCDNCREKLLY